MSSSMNTQSKKNCAITEYWNKHDADFKFSTGINDIVPAQVLNSVGEMYRNNDLRLKDFVCWKINSHKNEGYEIHAKWRNSNDDWNSVHMNSDTDGWNLANTIEIWSWNNKFALPEEYYASLH